MSKNKGFSNTSSNRYSLALFELGEELNLVKKIEENSVLFLNLISSNNDFKNFIKDPTLNKKDLTNVINKLSDTYNFELLFINFIHFLISKRRFFYVEKILKKFNEICSEKRGEIKAEINSAKKLSTDEINKITEDLSATFKSKINLNYNHDETLIGGLILQVGSTMIDTSIKSKLQQIENRMIGA